jgi:hypothetical protein
MVGQGADQEKKPVVRSIAPTTARFAGRMVAGWVGKLIVLFPTQAGFRGRLVAALPVRIPLKSDPKITTGKPKAKPAVEIEEPEPDQPDLGDDIEF